MHRRRYSGKLSVHNSGLENLLQACTVALDSLAIDDAQRLCAGRLPSALSTSIISMLRRTTSLSSITHLESTAMKASCCSLTGVLIAFILVRRARRRAARREACPPAMADCRQVDMSDNVVRFCQDRFQQVVRQPVWADQCSVLSL